MNGFTSVKGKVAIVTGASRGIGKGMAETFLSEGLEVVIVGKSNRIHDTFKELKEKYPKTNGYSVSADVSKEEDVKELIDGVIKKFGRLDIMVNNAGMHLPTGKVWETSEEQIDEIMGVNFKGEFFGCKYAAPQMIKQKSGTIVNISSYFGKVGHPDSATYGASKGAINTMTQALAGELAPYNVNVNAICPGHCATEMHWEFMQAEADDLGISFEELKARELKEIPLGRYGYGKDFAGTVLWLASDYGEFVTGQLINVNGGLDFT